MSSLLLLVLASASAADYLATFDGAPGTTFDWLETNDPVMGGKSHATFVVGDASRCAHPARRRTRRSARRRR